MTATEDYVRSLLDKVEDRERAARRRALIYTLIPVLVAAILLGFTAWRIQQANQELVVIQGELNSAQQRLATVNQDLDQAREQVRDSQQDLAETQANLEQARKNLSDTETMLATTSQELGLAEQQVEKLKSEVEEYQGQVVVLKTQIDELNKTRDELSNLYHQTTSYEESLYPGDILMATKYIASNFPAQGELITNIVFELPEIPWKLGGFSPQEGFDSPSFAAYMLDKYGLLPAPAEAARYNLRQVLNPVSRPQVGDLVFYELGYTMFYYIDDEQRPFVVGMTPAGVLALQYDFAKVLGFAQVNYR